MTEHSERAALRALIEQTAAALGQMDPSERPHEVRRRLERQVSDADDLDAMIADVLKSRPQR